VFHLAADVGGAGYIFGKSKNEILMNNLDIDLNVVKACKRAKIPKIIYFSSSCIHDKDNLYGNVTAPGQQRGNPNNKDSYFMVLFKISYVFGTSHYDYNCFK
jgi:nucleoside-diphosphate-sugar epimerase